jgi:hypothetical protein
MSYQVKPYTPKKSRKICVIDLEGVRNFKKSVVEPYLCGVYYPWNNEMFFRYFKESSCMKDFVDKFVTHKFRGHIFYAHFGSIYDFPILLDELNKRDFNIYPISKGGRIIKITVGDDSFHRWYFCDSSALLNFSLDELTKTFRVAHKKLKVADKNDMYDVNLHNLYLQSPKVVIEYLKHDCIGLYEVLDKFKNEILKIGGDLGLTIASTSMKTFTRKFQDKPFYMCEQETNDILRQGYYGGRTEIFRMIAPKQEHQVYYYYDINSLYPFVMHEYEYPTSKPNVVSMPTKRTITEGHGLTYADIVAPKGLYIPLLPSKLQIKESKKLMFVLGHYEGWWDNDFLRKAYELGYAIIPKKSYIFDSDYIFKGFVDSFYKIKQNAQKDTPMYMISKLIMNSLYGKYGQRQETESMIKDDTPDMDKYKIKSYDIETGWTTVIEHGKGKFYLPQISIHVTTMAQLWLYKSIEEILSKDYNVYYCDTDSIITDYGNMRTSKLLGEWKLEKKVMEGYFVLPKMYKLVSDDGHAEIRAKGYNKNLRNKIAANAFENALFKNDYKGFTVESSSPDMLRAKASFHRFKNFNHLDYMRRSIRTSYNKRKVLSDFNTRPFDIKELL